MAPLSLAAFRRGLKSALVHHEELASKSARGAARKKAAVRANPLLVAHHEMGHVVAAYLVGAEAGQASVMPRGLLVGRSTVHWSEADAGLALEQDTVVLLGGLVAERAFSGRASWKGVSSDLTRAFDLAREQLVAAPGREARVATSFLWKRYRAVSKLLGEPENAMAIRTLADALVAKGALSARQIRAALRQRGLKKVHAQTLSATSPAAPVRGDSLNRLNGGLSLGEAMLERLRDRVRRGDLPAAGTEDVGVFRHSWRTDAAGRVRVTVKEIAPAGAARSGRTG